MATRIIRCQGCGRETKAERSTRKWCEACKVLRLRESVRRHEQRQRQLRGKREPRSVATCRVCGDQFLAMRSDANQCSDKCNRLDLNRRGRESEKRHRHPCLDCGTSILRRSTRCKSCADPIAGKKRSGANHPSWKGGVHRDNKGYVHLLVYHDRKKGHRYRPEHTLVWEKANGKPLPKGWVIHHINAVKDDNRLENLEAMPRKKHADHHADRVRWVEGEMRKLQAELDQVKRAKTETSG